MLFWPMLRGTLKYKYGSQYTLLFSITEENQICTYRIYLNVKPIVKVLFFFIFYRQICIFLSMLAIRVRFL